MGPSSPKLIRSPILNHRPFGTCSAIPESSVNGYTPNQSPEHSPASPGGSRPVSPGPSKLGYLASRRGSVSPKNDGTQNRGRRRSSNFLELPGKKKEP